MKLSDAFKQHLARLAVASHVATGRPATYMTDLLTRLDGDGVVAWFKRDLKKPRISRGFQRMMTHKRPDLTAEVVIRDDAKFQSLFTDDDRQRAAGRLATFGF
jgi:hypothetical protein